VTTRAKVIVVAVAVVLLGGVAVGYTTLAGRKNTANSAASAGLPAAADLPTATTRQLLVLSSHGFLTSLNTDASNSSRTETTVRCDRSHAAAGTVACLRPNATYSAYQLIVLDRELHEQRTLPLPGLPNRLRVSASGRMIAWTMFIDGETYAGSAFSTRAGILDMTTAAVTGSLEDFAITLNGQPYRAADVNFWGITFGADDNRFYATMATAGKRYLVEGDYAARTVRTLKQNVECPQLSPDGTRVAFKQAINADPYQGWRLSVLDLATLRVTELAETRNVDDQAIWLDNETVGYSLQRADGINDTWVVPANGGGAPSLLTPDAGSPAVLG
jgi:hypothetical protein